VYGNPPIPLTHPSTQIYRLLGACFVGHHVLRSGKVLDMKMAWAKSCLILLLAVACGGSSENTEPLEMATVDSTEAVVSATSPSSSVTSTSSAEIATTTLAPRKVANGVVAGCGSFDSQPEAQEWFEENRDFGDFKCFTQRVVGSDLLWK